MTVYVGYHAQRFYHSAPIDLSTRADLGIWSSADKAMEFCRTNVRLCESREIESGHWEGVSGDRIRIWRLIGHEYVWIVMETPVSFEEWVGVVDRGPKATELAPRKPVEGSEPQGSLLTADSDVTAFLGQNQPRRLQPSNGCGVPTLGLLTLLGMVVAVVLVGLGMLAALRMLGWIV